MISAANIATLMTNGVGSGSSSTSSLSGLAAASGGRSMTSDQIDAVSKDFESMFLGQMIEQMFGDSEGADAFGDSETSDIYKGMMTQAYGKQIANAGGIGIADYVKKELLKMQEHV